VLHNEDYFDCTYWCEFNLSKYVETLLKQRSIADHSLDYISYEKLSEVIIVEPLIIKKSNGVAIVSGLKKG